ncbi:MAG: hypothetical protein Kow00114_06880 [Kiloniellaceae bacterium]
MDARRNQFQEMALAGPIGANEADQCRIIGNLQRDIFEVPPLIDLYASYPQSTLAPLAPYAQHFVNLLFVF